MRDVLFGAATAIVRALVSQVLRTAILRELHQPANDAGQGVLYWMVTIRCYDPSDGIIAWRNIQVLVSEVVISCSPCAFPLHHPPLVKWR